MEKCKSDVEEIRRLKGSYDVVCCDCIFRLSSVLVGGVVLCGAVLCGQGWTLTSGEPGRTGVSEIVKFFCSSY
jgi:hypothetical protein